MNHGLTICICTSGRPGVLERCLDSIVAGMKLPGAEHSGAEFPGAKLPGAGVIVSDDSAEPGLAAQIQKVCSRYEFVTYVEGPRRGLCANRNHVIRQATSSHVSLIDDDGVVSADFVERALAAIAEQPGKIITGDVIEEGIGRCPPTNPRFLGHFGKPVRPGERLMNIHLNCNAFPRHAFDVAAFDESIVYGYEDTDLCAQLLAKGYEIIYVPELVNEHRPPKRAADGAARRWQQERARFYVTVRRHGKWQRSLVRLVAFVLVAPVHLGLHTVKRRDWRHLLVGYPWVIQDLFALRRRPHNASNAGGPRRFTHRGVLHQT